MTCVYVHEQVFLPQFLSVLVSKRSSFWVRRNLVSLILKQKKWTYIIVGCRWPQHVRLFLYGSQLHKFTGVMEVSWKNSKLKILNMSLPNNNHKRFSAHFHHFKVEFIITAYIRSHLFAYMLHDNLQEEKVSNAWKHHGNFHPFMFIEQQNALWVLDPLCAFNKSWTVLMVKCHCLNAATKIKYELWYCTVRSSNLSFILFLPELFLSIIERQVFIFN